MVERRAAVARQQQHAVLRWRRTKIVATLGPASAEPAVLDRLVAAGVDVIRLNMSHGDHSGHRENVRRVRAAASNCATARP